MANPWLIAGALLALGHCQRKSREAEEAARRIAELEKMVNGEQPAAPPPVITNNGTDPGGCLGCLVCLGALGVMAVVLLAMGWMAFG